MRNIFFVLAIFLVCTSVIIGCSAPVTTTSSTPAVITAPASTGPSSQVPTQSASTPTVTKPSVQTTTLAPSSTPKPTSTTPAQLYGGTFIKIESAAPASPLGWPAETIGSSIRTVCLPLQSPINEQVDGSFTPSLAVSWDVNPDPKNSSVTLHLGKGVKFQDGTDFNAQACKWNLEQVKANPINNATTSAWKSFDVLDDYTLRVNFNIWQTINARTFTGLASFQVSPSAYQKNGLDWMRLNAVGTGPFTQTDFKRDVSYTTVKNTSYWEPGKPYLDRVQYLYVTDQLTRVALFKSGGGQELDVADNARLASQLQTEGYKIITKQAGAYALIPDSVNADSPWSNLKVRQAAEYAIDKEAIAKTFGYGFTSAAYQYPNQNSPAYISTITGRKYDPAKAKQLLAEAGYPNGFKTTIIASPITNRDIPTAFQAYLGAVGIQAALDFPELARYTTYQVGTWKNALLYSTGLDYPDFNAILNQQLGPTSSQFQSMKKPDGWKDMFTASLTAPAPDISLMKKLVQAMYDDATNIPIYYGVSLWADTNQVHDTGIGTRGSSSYWNPQNTWLSK